MLLAGIIIHIVYSQFCFVSIQSLIPSSFSKLNFDSGCIFQVSREYSKGRTQLNHTNNFQYVKSPSSKKHLRQWLYSNGPDIGRSVLKSQDANILAFHCRLHKSTTIYISVISCYYAKNTYNLICAWPNVPGYTFPIYLFAINLKFHKLSEFFVMWTYKLRLLDKMLASQWCHLKL